MKKLLPVGVLVLALTAAIILNQQRGASAAPDHNASFVVNQATFIADGQARAMDVVPFVEGNRTYVPARYLAYALGIPENGVIWDALNQSATFTSSDGKTIIITVGRAVLTVDGSEQAIDAPPLLKEGRVFLPVRWLAQALGYEVGWDEATSTVLVGPPGSIAHKPANEAAPLPSVGSYENLKDLLANAQSRNGGFYNEVLFDQALTLRAPQSANQKAESSATGAASPQSDADYSKTNIQVEGVDEADIVKTDGVYIYQVNRERVVVTRAQPAADMAVVSTLDFTGKDFSPLEMYVDEKYLVVIGTTHSQVYEPMYKDESQKRIGIMPPYYRNTVKAIIYNIEDKSGIKQLRELELNGSYISSRKIGSSFYLVANQHLYYSPGSEIENPRPLYRDTAVKDSFIEIDYPNIKCFPDFIQPGYLLVAGINLDQPDQEASVSSYLGSGDNIYASTANLYVAVTGYRQFKEADQELLPAPYSSNVTRIYRFTLSEGRVSYAAKGEAPGHILNQFSMDEHLGNFRIATTQGDIWRTDQYTSRNNVFIMDENLNITGRLENIAPGEKIYSARFIGDRGYLVTFKTVDPFFVLDLKDPGNPAILGALKIPGYSDYLHPYDENHVIGFGKDTVELSGGNTFSADESMAFYTGMKMALFDVTDVNNPVEMFRETIGDRGTDSELLHNHKALLFDKDKNLLAFPVRVMVVDESQAAPDGAIPQYGTFAFQGAYVYNLDLTHGFSLKGKITHLSAEDYLKAGNYWYDSDKNVARILYINDDLYTLSNSYIVANRLDDLHEIKRLEIK